MKAYTRNTLKDRAEREVRKAYDEIYYEAFREFAPDVVRQTIAVMLYAMALNGYGEKRLKRILEWVDAVMQVPSIGGKIPTCNDCVAVLKKRYGIDLSSISPNLQTWEEYKKSGEKL